MIPKASKTFVDFAGLLRAYGFAVSPDQTIGFIEAVGLLGPRSMEDIRASALAMFAIAKDREDEFDALFRTFFYGQTLAPPVEGDEEDDVEAHEPGMETLDVPVEEDEDDPGDTASGAEILSQRAFAREDEALVSLKDFGRRAERMLPRRTSYRFLSSNKGRRLNMRQVLKAASRTDGDAILLPMLDRKQKQRKILLLVDVSGSMRDQSEGYLRFAHALAQSAQSFECFTLGTRLTRITASLKPKDRDQALSRVTAAVADFDGGTRIGDALSAYLNVPRFAGYARGALVLILSDGLERGDPTQMIDAVARFSRMAWRLHWLSPLAGDDDFAPQTEALSAVLPKLDSLSGARTIEAVCHHVLNVARAA
ncbi:MAG: VWA domain-containing protein [Pseudomonadota bacterium]